MSPPCPDPSRERSGQPRRVSLRLAFVLAALLQASPAQALPGSLTPSIAPALRTPTSDLRTVRAADGSVHVWGAFHTVDGVESGGVVRLLPDGTIGSVLASQLRTLPPQFPITKPVGLLPLSDGRQLVLVDSSGAVITSDGAISTAFLTGLPAEVVRLLPQFELDGDLYFIVFEADGERRLARQATAAPAWSPQWLDRPEWPLPPLSALPGPDGLIRLIVSDAAAAFPLTLPLYPVHQQMFLIDREGELIAEVSAWQPPTDRLATFDASEPTGYRVQIGPSVTRWRYWPSPTASHHRLEWYSSGNQLLRSMDFTIPLFGSFVHAVEADGAVVAILPQGGLGRWLADGSFDQAFTDPGPATGILALAGGKWLLDDARRILPDGRDDPAWNRPRLEQPAEFHQIVPTLDGGLLLAGNVARAGGSAVNRIVKLRHDGTIDSTFTADPRLPGATALAQAPDGGIFVATGRPVFLEDGRGSDLVRLMPDGSLDEAWAGWPGGSPPFEPVGTIRTIACQPDGALLIMTSHPGSSVSSTRLSRRLPDGSVDQNFGTTRELVAWNSLAALDLLVLRDGSFIFFGNLFAADGSALDILDNVTRAYFEEADGSLIVHRSGGGLSGLGRWKAGVFDSSFVPAVRQVDLVRPGPGGTLYVTHWVGSDTGPAITRIVRLLPDGRIDPTFRSGMVETWPSRSEGPWVTLADGGIVPMDPAEWARPGTVRDFWSDPDSGDLWIAGSFNMLDSQPRDGLAVLSGTIPKDYTAWSLAALRSRPESAGPDDDASGDGHPNLLAYATGGDPLLPGAGSVALQSIPGDTVRFSLALNPFATELLHWIELSDDLASWRPAGPHEVVTHRHARHLEITLEPVSTARFIRVRVSLD